MHVLRRVGTWPLGASAASHLCEFMASSGRPVQHTYPAQDTVRFYALRAHELGMIKRDPKLFAEGTDFRFFEELKRELKA